tara:strand:+ start:52 stop:858 length:807 start_codon:yes stop_codon:yes gene_type:complete
MFNKYFDELSQNGKQLITDGYFIVDIEQPSKLELIKQSFIDYLIREHNIKISIEDLHLLHKDLPLKILNDIRYGFFQYINQLTANFAFEYLQLVSEAMFDVVGTELAANRTVNFSIQLPGDESSLLPIHSDAFSGESPFQINLWVPLVDVCGTNSMFIFNPEFSREICRDIRRFEEQGIDHLVDDYPNEFQYLELLYGQALIFTPTCLHGNVINSTEHSRISFNCRYKNLYSPYNEFEENEKKLGSFYQPITPKAATIIGLNFEFDKE